MELVLANAANTRNVPGRTSDVSDATWIADLPAYGLIRNSFVPPARIMELRDLTRTTYQDLGGDYFAKRDAERTARHLAKRMRRLGYDVRISKAA